MNRPLSELTLEELWQLFPIVLSEYDPAWPVWYAEEAEALKGLLDFSLLRIRHIGSTSVPGLVAKPTVDILLEIADEALPAEVRRALEAGGWTTMAEANVREWRLDMCKGY
ncbi:MAG: GrpB family protein, partial [Lentisphaeria bacterium]|nr:GrpB family protein [Lentisphaeria bacterium]